MTLREFRTHGTFPWGLTRTAQETFAMFVFGENANNESMKRSLALLVLWFAALSIAAQTRSQSPHAQPGMEQANTAANAVGTQAPIDPVKGADIRRLLEVAGTKNLMATMMDSMQTSMRPLMVSSLPAGEYRDKLINLFLQRFRAKANLGQLLDFAIPLYDKHFSDQEIKELISFYDSPLGRKVVTAMPQIMTELQGHGRQWGQNLGRECMQEGLAENPDLAAQLTAATKGGAAK
jgi:uncharacterized protein